MRTAKAKGALRSHTRRRGSYCAAGLGLVGLLIGAETILAECAQPVARAVSVQGSVFIQPAGTTIWNSLILEQRLCVEDTVRVGSSSRAVLRLEDHTTLPLDEESVLSPPVVNVLEVAV